MTYTPLQLEIIRIFGKKEWKDGCLFISQEDYHCGDSLYEKSEVYGILGHIPHLEDVFRVANDKDLAIHANLDSKFVSELKAYRNSKEGIVKIPYNPTLSLLSQTDEIKKSIINLFS